MSNFIKFYAILLSFYEKNGVILINFVWITFFSKNVKCCVTFPQFVNIIFYGNLICYFQICVQVCVKWGFEMNTILYVFTQQIFEFNSTRIPKMYSLPYVWCFVTKLEGKMCVILLENSELVRNLKHSAFIKSIISLVMVQWNVLLFIRRWLPIEGPVKVV